MYILKI